MQPETLQPIVRGALGTSLSALYTNPTPSPSTAAAATIQEIVFTNTTGSPITVTLHIVPAGQAAQTSTQLYGAFSVPANSNNRDPYALAVLPGDSIQGLASAAGVNVYITASMWGGPN